MHRNFSLLINSKRLISCILSSWRSLELDYILIDLRSVSMNIGICCIEVHMKAESNTFNMVVSLTLSQDSFLRIISIKVDS